MRISSCICRWFAVLLVGAAVVLPTSFARGQGRVAPRLISSFTVPFQSHTQNTDPGMLAADRMVASNVIVKVAPVAAVIQ